VHISTTGYRCSILLNNIEQIATKAMQYKLNYVSQSNLTPQSLSSGIADEVKGGAMMELSRLRERAVRTSVLDSIG
jgi:hypothetical protein